MRKPAVVGSWAVVLAGLMDVQGAMAADEPHQLLGLINDFRQSPRCQGHSVAKVRSLTLSPLLSSVAYDFSSSLQKTLKKAGYPLLKAQALALGGKAAADVLETLVDQDCELLVSSVYTELGIRHQGGQWQLIWARPVITAELGSWQVEGQVILEQINALRRKPQRCGREVFYAVPALRWNARLAEAAWRHSREMAQHDYLGHLDRQGQTVGQRLREAGYHWSHAGENIAGQQSSGQAVVAAWMASPEHCANIMNPAFTEMGAAYALNPAGRAVVYWSQTLASPAGD